MKGRERRKKGDGEIVGDEISQSGLAITLLQRISATVRQS
jgi:hypothetical protein